MDNKTKSAVIAGGIAGLLASLPFVNLLNFCCCLWAIGGGALAAYLYIKRAPPVQLWEGAILGLIAGLVAGVVYLVIGVPLNYAFSTVISGSVTSFIASLDPTQAAQVERQFAQGQSIVLAYVQGFFQTLLWIGLSVVGGLLGVAIFEKRKDTPGSPPPPPAYGGTSYDTPGAQPGGGYNNPPSSGTYGEQPGGNNPQGGYGA